MMERGSGVLLHLTSLPGQYGAGDLGAEAYRFVDFLASAGQSYWQILPPTPPGAGDSPYDARSAMAGNPALVSLEPLVDDGLLSEVEVDAARVPNHGRADFPAAAAAKDRMLRRAHRRAECGGHRDLVGSVRRFAVREAAWVGDFALYMALRRAHRGLPWYEWEPGLVERRPYRLAIWRERLRHEVDYHVFVQYLFDQQWLRLQHYAYVRGIRIVGDVPIYVALDSADVWAHQPLFALDRRGRPTAAAGVPPDMFSATGQLWGNPCYRWDVVAADGYAWWIQRFRRALALTDIVRVDHFRGFQAGWQVPGGARTAIQGQWVPGPGKDLFERLGAALGRLPIIVEDLGVITPDVVALRQDLGYPGMRVLQFAFGANALNPYLPHNYEPNTVVYTGTHDNDTAVGWHRTSAPDVREHLREYLGRDPVEVNWSLIRLAMASVAHTAIVPLQDVLGLDSCGRMNLPGTAWGNWGWRLRDGALDPAHSARLRSLTETFGRLAGTR